MNANHASKREGTFRFRRILMALDPASEDLSAVEETAALARRLQAELLHLFVEDIDLVRLAQHTEVSAFSTLSAGPQPFAAENLKRALKLQLARSRHAVEQAAARQRIKAVFQIRQGRPVAEVLSAAGAADLVVVEWVRRDTTASSVLSPAATARAIAEAASRSVLLLRPGTPVGGPVLVVYNRADYDRHALEAAAEIAERDGGIVEVAVLTGQMDHADEWRREILDAMAHTHVTVRFLHMPNAGLEDLCAASARRGTSLMVLGADQDILKGAAGQRTLERVGCSVLLVR